MEKRILFVLLEEYADWEGAYLASEIMRSSNEESNNYCVKTVSLIKEPVHSIGGFTTLPDYAIDSVDNHFNGLILIGGNSWRKESSKKVIPLIKKALENNAVLGAICDATVFLGMNGFLNEGKHTSNQLEELKKAAGKNYSGEKEYINQQAVRDGNRITANGTAALEFSKEVLVALGIKNKAEADDWYHFHKLGYCKYMKQLNNIG
ncbi:glutamine amidotransferase [Sporolactobacillus shoreicorticis]|uniref:Type 1 glutamine amidotransferase family protein n=1 Tax=Sporolactobacillus shoreicorticis TaxID=1923877 RepID=A0ABW5S186_9BACL|nr:type 1 glutamine amidotransferase family protein [Sporolactobacillus shoreicorticis]MCO7125408.1 glutamine amidotransferase [Sporolactobacillus shoreicorticis]